MSDRIRLDQRRPNVTVKIEHEGMTFFITFGYDLQTGRVLEVFGDAKKQTTSFEYLIADACVAISLALQFGVTPEHLVRSMHWSFQTDGVSPYATRTPASVIGKIVQAIIAEETLIRRGLDNDSDQREVQSERRSTDRPDQEESE